MVTGDVGAGADQFINLPAPALGQAAIGLQHTIRTVAHGAGTGNMILTNKGANSFAAMDTAKRTIATLSTVSLDAVSAGVVVNWSGSTWHIVNALNNSDATAVVNSRLMIPPVGAANAPVVDFQKPIFAASSATPVDANVSGVSDLGVSNCFEVILLSNASPTAVDPDIHTSYVTSDSSGLPNPIALAGSTAQVGLRKVVHYSSGVGDTVPLDLTNIRNADGSVFSSVIFTANSQLLVLEQWQDGNWRAVTATPGVCTPEVKAPVFPGHDAQTAVAGAATSTAPNVFVTSEALVAATSYTLTLTDALITATSILQVAAWNGLSTGAQVTDITPGSGSATIALAFAALTGTVKINVSIFN